MERSEFNISISVESYDEKTAKNYRNFYDAKNRIVNCKYNHRGGYQCIIEFNMFVVPYHGNVKLFIIEIQLYCNNTT